MIMIEKIYLGLILVFFILAFAIRNIKTYLSTRQSIRGKSIKVTISILLSTLLYGLIILRLTVLSSYWTLELDLTEYLVLKYIGFAIVTIGFIIGIVALTAMKNSWRVGIKYDQRTDLITTGIYKVSRNPYFLSFDIMFLGFVIIFPSLILFVLNLLLAIIFHYMILEEEKYLQTVHGDLYLDYKRKVSRYIIIK